MKKIRHIIEQIEDEIRGAEDYAMCSLKMSEEDKNLSELYRQLATVELGHVDVLHDQVSRLIAEYREKGNEPPASMQAVWDWEHSKMTEHVARIKSVLR